MRKAASDLEGKPFPLLDFAGAFGSTSTYFAGDGALRGEEVPAM